MGRAPVGHAEPAEEVVIEMPGGGGYGDPFARDPERVLCDVRGGYVSVDITGEGALHDRGYAWLKSPPGLAGLMAPLGLVARHAREDGRRGPFYLPDPAALADLATRYNPAASEGAGAGLSLETADNR